jgi:hypothetical protein
MSGDLAGAYKAVFRSSLLRGDEKKAWADSIEQASKIKPEQIDPVVETNEIVKVLGMMRNDKPSKEIVDYIVKNPYMRKENKEQYINQAETKYGKEIDYAKRLGDGVIYDAIIPKRGITEAILETPLEKVAVREGQAAFSEWLADVVKKDKKLTDKEIVDKARALAVRYQVSISKRIKFMEEEAARQTKEMEDIEKAKKEGTMIFPETIGVRGKIER